MKLAIRMFVPAFDTLAAKQPRRLRRKASSQTAFSVNPSTRGDRATGGNPAHAELTAVSRCVAIRNLRVRDQATRARCRRARPAIYLVRFGEIGA
jgi:hypothetical protein